LEYFTAFMGCVTIGFSMFVMVIADLEHPTVVG
jgi:hypothetical protein